MHAALERKLFAVESASVRLGRFVILSRLGAGAMGVVYRSYDPQLQREVAIKLLTPRGEWDSVKGRLKEAQALARLSHPHVLTIYEAGIEGDSVYVVTEIIDGQALDAWSTANPPGARARFRRALDIAVVAGEGLAAAHAAGMVHRDVKPANVLVGEDGRVRVADFGLARVSPHAGGGVTQVAGPSDLNATPARTTDGADGSYGRGPAGTPAYMAPEAFDGDANAATDQFSFCCAFYEVFGGRLPFGSSQGAARSEQIVAGQFDESTYPIPAWLRRVLHRGLAADPARRYASMDELVRALRAGRTSRKRVLWGGVAVAAVGMAWFSVGRREATVKCAYTLEALGDAWDDDKRASLRATLGSAEASDAVEAVLDRFSEGWLTQRRDACEATWERGEQSQANLDLRMGCLDSARDALGMLSAQFQGLSGPERRAAVRSAYALPDVNDCGRMSWLLARQEAGVAEPELSQHLADLLWRAGVADKLEQRPLRDTLLDQVEREANDSTNSARAEVFAHRVADKRRSGETKAALELAIAALDAAQRSRSPDVIVMAWTQLGGVRMVLGDLDAADFCLDRAAAWDSHGGTRSRRRLDVLRVRAEVLDARGKHSEAVTHWEQVVTELRMAYGPDGYSLGPALTGYANALQRLGRLDDAAEAYRAAIANERAIGGEGTSRVAGPVANLGVLEFRLGRNAAARELVEEALRLLVASARPAPAREAPMRLTLGQILMAQGDLVAAESALSTGKRLMGEVYGEQSVQVATAALVLGDLALQQERPTDAAVQYRLALAGLPGAEDTRYDHYGAAQHSLAQAQSQLGQHDEAVVLADAALVRLRASVPKDEAAFGSALGAIAQVHAAAGRATALALYAEASALTSPSAKERGSFTFRLAELLWETGSRQRAISTALEARTLLADTKPGDEVRQRLDAWIAAHPE